MGATNFGNQLITVQFLDFIEPGVLNRIGQTVRKTGYYSGVYLTKISDVSVQLSPGEFEIKSSNLQPDSRYRQVRITTTAVQNISISSGTPYVILRYTYEDNSTHYADMISVAVGSIQSNDLIVGKATFSGATLTGFDYSSRNDADVIHLFLKAEQNIVPDMKLIVRRGRVNYGSENFEIYTQTSPTFTAPTTNPRIDVLYVDTDGALKVNQGTEAVTPSSPSYGSKVVIAEVTLSVGQTSILNANIKDVRNHLSAGTASGVSGGGVSGQSTNLKLTVAGTSASSASLTANSVSLKNTLNQVIVVSNINLTVSINGSGLNGLDTGVKANNTKYFVWIVYNPATLVVGAVFSLSSVIPTLPSGFTYYELFSFGRTEGTGNLLGARHRGDIYRYKTWPQVVTAYSARAWTAVDLTSYVPVEISDVAFGSAATAARTQYAYVSNDNTIAIGSASTLPTNQYGHEEPEHTNYNAFYWEFEFITPGVVYWATDSGSYSSESMYLHGFKITR